MSKDKGYWVKVLDEEKANILISLGFSCCSDVAIIKVAEDEGREGYVYLVNDNMIKLDKSYLRPLSYLNALNLDMGHNAKWRELCADCLSNELSGVLKNSEKDRNKTYKPKEMTSIIDLFREQSELFDKFAEVICSTKFEPVKEEINLPDEIDLYNFFEKYKGVTKGIMTDRSYSKLCGYYAYFMTKNFEIENLSEYLSVYESIATVNYYIGNNRYYAIKFKDRGVFLVSEKRYNELKAKKGK